MSMPSLAHWLTKTMATFEDAASAAAADASVPSLNCTLAPGAIARIAASGGDGSQTTCDQQGGQGKPSVSDAPPLGQTCAEPPPESTPISACEPMTAMEVRPAALSGSVPSFFSSTAPCSSASCATASPAATSTGWVERG